LIYQDLLYISKILNSKQFSKFKYQILIVIAGLVHPVLDTGQSRKNAWGKIIAFILRLLRKQSVFLDAPHLRGMTEIWMLNPQSFDGASKFSMTK